MSSGKIASQAGHAYLGAFIEATTKTPQTATAYASLRPGTKVCFGAKLPRLIRTADAAAKAGIPHCIITDSGCPDFCEGKPTITALGIGPATRDQVKAFTVNLSLL